MRAAAGLHGGDLHRVGDVADVEDPHALEPRADGRVGAAVDPGAGLLDRHEQQVAVDRHVALAAGAHHVGDVGRVGRVGDVVDVEAVEVADEGVVAAEGEVGATMPEKPSTGESKGATRGSLSRRSTLVSADVQVLRGQAHARVVHRRGGRDRQAQGQDGGADHGDGSKRNGDSSSNLHRRAG